MSNVPMKCPYCDKKDPEIVGQTKQISISSVIKNIHVMFCGACGSILSCVLKP